MMSMLAFFPWFSINSEIDLDRIKLIPFIKDDSTTSNINANQSACERILSPYKSKNGQSINRATIVKLKDKPLFDDLNEDDIAYLFSISEIIALGGLSNRVYFSDIDYCNRDYFSFVVQSFSDHSTSVSITTRRRDGFCKQIITGSVYKVEIPMHVTSMSSGSTSSNKLFDIALIKSLIHAQDTLLDGWDEYADAIFHFNKANTDDIQTSEHQEVVMLIGAIERILSCSTGKEDSLVKKFMALFVPYDNYNISKSQRIPRTRYEGKSHNIRDAWIKDYFRLRGDYAHGKRLSRQEYAWKPHEHLLLGSYIFPLLVKLRLNNDKFYKLTETDCFNINVFEELADADLFNKKSLEDTNIEWKWNEIREKSAYNPIHSKIAKL